MVTAEEALRLADAYCGAKGISRTTLATKMLGSSKGKIFDRIAEGLVGIADALTLEQIEVWFTAFWPDDLDWPSDIEKRVKQRKHLAKSAPRPSTQVNWSRAQQEQPKGVSVLAVPDHPELLRLQVDQILPWQLALELMTKLKQVELGEP